MELQKSSFPTGLTFDDVLLLPGYSDFSRKDIDLSTQLTRRIKLSIPLVSAPMDTVTGSKLAIVLAKLGGIGIIHRNLNVSRTEKSDLVLGLTQLVSQLCPDTISLYDVCTALILCTYYVILVI